MMSKSAESSLAKDRYPSRKGLPTRLINREDPVVYQQNLAHAPISQAQIEHYQKNGFVVLDNLFNDAEVSLLQHELTSLSTNPAATEDTVTITEPDSGEIRSIFQVHLISDTFKKLAADPRLANLARFILGDAVYIHQSRLNYKPSFRGKDFYWHSDFETWHVEDGMPNMRALSMSIMLTDNYSVNGPLMIIPRTQQQYISCTGTTPEQNYLESLKQQYLGVPSDQVLTDLVHKNGIVEAVCKKGSVIVFDCNVLHGSNSNITPYPRSNAFFVYNAVSNRLLKPFCNQAPRPEHLATRDTFAESCILN